MKPLRTILLLPLMLALVAALAACGGDDAPTDEEYFQRMDEIDKETDTRFESLCEGDDISGKQCATEFAGGLSATETEIKDVKPSEDAKDEHDELVAGLTELRENVENSADELTEDDSQDVFFESGAFDTTRVDAAFCTLQDLADSKNITADVGCDAGDAGPDPATLEPVETTDVLMQDFAFDPPHVQVSVGDTVTWEQGSDPAPHNASADDESFSFDPIDEEGGTGEATFDEAGVFPYSCDVHPEMRGQVTVVE